MKAKECVLTISTRYKMINLGTFPSIAAAKKYVRECVTSPYTITPKTQG
jgi:hypothetical protein